MSDEPVINSNTLADPVLAKAKDDAAKEKQSNITYSQSEFDKAVKDQVASVSNKYSDYDLVKTQLDELAKEKEEREMADKTDLEKSLAANEKLQQEIDKLNGEKSIFEKDKLKSEVLSDVKYNSMSKVYRDAVAPDSDIEKVKASADAYLEQYNTDHNVQRETFGIPNELKKPETLNTKSIGSIKEMMKQKIAILSNKN